MLPEKLKFEVVTPERKVLSETVDDIILPGKMGYFGVRPGHTPFLTSLFPGLITYTAGGKKMYMAVSWGFCEVLQERVIVLAETAERADEIDVERARGKRAQADEVLKLKRGDAEFRVAEVRMKKALARLEAYERSRMS